jgi:hypothetical protein
MLVVGGCAGGLYQQLFIALDSYETTTTHSLNGTTVSLGMHPQKQVHGAYGDRVTGPPFLVTVAVSAIEKRPVTSRLHKLQLRREDGADVDAELINPEDCFSEYSRVTLEAILKADPGDRGTLIADLEVVRTNAKTRAKLTFPLRAETSHELDLLRGR